jgi:four helix bundle protein
MEKTKIKNFTDLLIWQRGHQIVLKIYKITKEFPSEEKFALTDQLRRAAVSITSNIAEGFGRDKMNDKAHFYTMALGSIYEVQNQLLIAKDVRYLDGGECEILFNECMEISKMSLALIKKIRNLT